MRTKGTTTELEARRHQIAVLLDDGSHTSVEIAEIIGVSLSTVKRVKKLYQQGGLPALAVKPSSGRASKLNASQKKSLYRLLKRGALKAGFDSEWWTCRRIAEVVLRELKVRYHPGHLSRILREIGWTPQIPKKQDPRRDEQAIARWRTHDWPRIKKRESEVKLA